MAFNNQGSRPNYQSTLLPLNHPKPAYSTRDHETFLGAAAFELSEVTERTSLCTFEFPCYSNYVFTSLRATFNEKKVDFEQPRALVTKVMDETARAHLVENLAGHLGNVKTQAIKERQLAIFAAVDQSFSDAVAKAIGHPSVKPLQVKPATEAIRFRPNLKQ